MVIKGDGAILLLAWESARGGSSFASAWMEPGFVHEHTPNSIVTHAGSFAPGGCVDMGQLYRG
jgi:hypothetical protein